MKEHARKDGLSRREFIKTTGVTAAGLMAGSLRDEKVQASAATAPASGRILGANDRISYGIIGVGGMGSGHLNILKEFSEKENLAVRAVCDVFDKRRRKAQAAAGIADSQVYEDYRRMLENKDIDVVAIAWNYQQPIYLRKERLCVVSSMSLSMFIKQPFPPLSSISAVN